MTFSDEPAWMQAARKAPLRSTWESRQPKESPPPAPLHVQGSTATIAK